MYSNSLPRLTIEQQIYVSCSAPTCYMPYQMNVIRGQTLVPSQAKVNVLHTVLQLKNASDQVC